MTGHLDLPPLALSVRQPWAWAIIFAGKHLENRSRAALKHMLGRLKRGRICIHASSGMTQDEYESARETIARATAAHGKPIEYPRPDELLRGGIIGTVEVTGTLKPMESTSPWWAGGPALTLRDPVALETPIPCLGELGYFDWTDPRCHERVTRRGHYDEKREPAAFDPPKPWMIKWGRAPGTVREVKARGIAPAPLFEREG